ncbi:hypothetical protein BAUCODRAFT_232309 [Baudoinia panamericana UAMH 10762]|uniref:Thiaminase-2/PQQC domain-containing protein n=1 Tax=Baudoinia panamericana (strain UAMH 10762) TaxID=717646 RepID=M2N3B6_BAUPA|nr:uncharacterized protein BAUCODRAFT_232309 [Baudoinia panamericana UAMH 10762]EMC93205.1 hypothetical protein BAUCODRAFT_232309 [Baudoinia panamericana UAMH 10762]
MPSLTSHLLHLSPPSLHAATHHPFLSLAATASAPPALLKHWLAQDRLYALSYLSFAGTLLSRIPMPTHAEREKSLEWRAADLIIEALVNIRREVRLFEETAEAEGWLEEICGVEASVQTRAYQDLFAGATAQGRPLIVGLVVLWATEEVYLRAWRYAKGKMDPGVSDGEKDVMQRVFIPNWSSREFEAFVRKLGGLINMFGLACEGEREEREEDGEVSWQWRECERAWGQVLWAETHFWPDVGGEVKANGAGKEEVEKRKGVLKK